MAPRRCRPNLRKCMLETNDPDAPKWWQRYLEGVETEICKPATERPDTVFSVISDRATFKMVSAILKLDEAECDILCIKETERLDKLEQEALELQLSEERRLSKFKEESGIGFEESGEGTLMSAITEESVKELEGDVVEHDISSSEFDSRTSIEQQGHSQHDISESYDAYTNPYLRFVRAPPERARCWRPRPPPEPTDVYEADPNMTLIEKSACVTNKIASDFCSWMRGLGSATPPTIDEKVLIELFEFEFDKPAARALANKIREATTLPPTMAKVMDFPELDYRRFVRNQIDRDIAAEQVLPRRMAFGCKLGPDERLEPPRNDTLAQWRGFKPPNDLASFSTAFAGLSHMESFTGFCRHLQNNPHLQRPSCLKSWGVLEMSGTSLGAVPSSGSLEVDLRVAGYLASEVKESSLTLDNREPSLMST